MFLYLRGKKGVGRCNVIFGARLVCGYWGLASVRHISSGRAEGRQPAHNFSLSPSIRFFVWFPPAASCALLQRQHHQPCRARSPSPSIIDRRRISVPTLEAFFFCCTAASANPFSFASRLKRTKGSVLWRRARGSGGFWRSRESLPSSPSASICSYPPSRPTCKGGGESEVRPICSLFFFFDWIEPFFSLSFLAFLFCYLDQCGWSLIQATSSWLLCLDIMSCIVPLKNAGIIGSLHYSYL